MTYEIHTWTFCDGWRNNSHENEKPLQFDNYQDAKAEKQDMVNWFDFQANEVRIVNINKGDKR